MSRRPSRFTEADLKKALKVAGDRAVEISPTGAILILPPGEHVSEKKPDRSVARFNL